MRPRSVAHRLAPVRAVALVTVLVLTQRAEAQHTYPGQPQPLPDETRSAESPQSESESESSQKEILLDEPLDPNNPKPGRQSLQQIATVGFEPGPLERRLQSYLPLFKNLAGKFADRLPLPLGLDFAFVSQWNKQIFTSNQVTFRGNTINIPRQNFSTLHNRSRSYVGVIDAWLLPFLNIYGVAGYTTGELSFDVSLPEHGNLSGHVDKKLHGYTAGGGAVVGGAYNNFFGLVNTTYVTSDLNIFTENVETFAVSPRIGYEHVLGPLKGTFTVGPNYYRQSSLRASTFEFNGEELRLDFKVKEKNPWNTAVGVRAVVFHRFDIALSGAFGSRRALLLRIGGRF